MARIREHKWLYGLLGLGAVGTFFGHGMWAVRGKESFIDLLNGSLDHVFGVEISARTGETWVKLIGWADVTIAVVFTLLIVGAIRERGPLYRLAYSPFAMGLFGWGVLWGFATAFSRMTAVGEFYPEVWDLVERAPNFMLPAAMIYVIARHRTLVVPTHVPSEKTYTKV